MTTISAASHEGEEIIVPNRWVVFLRDWDWDVPEYGGRATKTFPAGWRGRLTHRQYQPAIDAGVAVSIESPRMRFLSDGGTDV